MPIRYHRDDEQRRIVLTIEGQLTISEWAECLARQIEEEVWGYGTLYDFTAADARFPGPGELATIAKATMQLAEQHAARGPVAFAVMDDAEHHGIHGWLVTVGAALPFRMAVFRTREDAERWLDAAQRRG